jgi:hypothetical protein
MLRIAWTGLAVMAACGHGGSAPDPDRIEFYGVVIDVPPGTSSSSSGSHLPMNYEGAPTEVTPGITLFRPDTHDFALAIQKLPGVVSLDGMKWTMGQQAQASRIAGRPTGSGWDVEYRWTSDGAPPTTIYVRYLQLPDQQYQCQYDDGSSKQLAVAEAICRSIRPRPAAK